MSGERGLGRTVVRTEWLRAGFGAAEVLRGASLELRAGELAALVGDSGGGKSLLGRCLLGLPGEGAWLRARRLEVDGIDVLGSQPAELRALRRRRVGAVPQDALGALDPLRRVGTALEGALLDAGVDGRAARRARALELLGRAGADDPERFLRAHPFELSGGERQRALLALALAGDPALLIADEPSAALDAELAAATVGLLASLAAEGRAVLVITHDRALVAPVAHRMLALREGRIAPLEAEDAAPARTTSGPSAARPEGRALEGRGLARTFSTRRGPRRVLDGVDVRVAAGESTALLGPSGSGKSTLGRLLVGLDRPDAGEVRVDGIARRDAHSPSSLRGAVGLVPQDPLGSFDPRKTVGRLLLEGRALGCRRDAAPVPDEDGAWLAAALAEVRLDPSLAARRPLRLSGGQRQRVAIARALAARPRYLVCDELTSALDATARGAVLDLLDELRAGRGLGLLLITHDPDVAGRAERIIRLEAGRIRAAGPA